MKYIDVPNFEDIYEIAVDGSRVRSKTRYDCRGQRRDSRVMKLSRSGPKGSNKGYLFFGAQKDRKVKIIYIHHLVALLHHGPRPPKHQVNHKDGVKDHNWPDNLEYVTCKYNRLHSHRILGQNIGSKHHNSKLTKAKVIWMRKNKGKVSIRAMAVKFNIHPSSVQDVLSRRTWNHDFK